MRGCEEVSNEIQKQIIEIEMVKYEEFLEAAKHLIFDIRLTQFHNFKLKNIFSHPKSLMNFCQTETLTRSECR